MVQRRLDRRCADDSDTRTGPPPGDEKPATSTDPAIELRAKHTPTGWLIIATNSLPKPIRTTITLPDLPDATLHLPFDHQTIDAHANHWDDRFAPHEVKVYLTGHEPKMP
jgi:hypothetical protein